MADVLTPQDKINENNDTIELLTSKFNQKLSEKSDNLNFYMMSVYEHHTQQNIDAVVAIFAKAGWNASAKKTINGTDLILQTK